MFQQPMLPTLLRLPAATPPHITCSCLFPHHRIHNQNAADFPPVLPKNKKKPFVSPPRRGGFWSRKSPKRPLENPMFPPGNGLLVPELVPVAHAVFEARHALLQLVANLLDVAPVQACKFCDEIHVGYVGHELATCQGSGADSRHSRHLWTAGDVHDILVSLDAYHCFDRFQLIKHDARFNLKRLPALVELCIQAGVDLPEYPTLRRRHPVRYSGKKIAEADKLFSEFQREIDALFVHDEEISNLDIENRSQPISGIGEDNELFIEPEFEHDQFVSECETQCSKWRNQAAMASLNGKMSSMSVEDIKQIAEMTLRVWDMMRTGTQLLMKKYAVRVCGYCPEVNIGPRGHKVRLCGEFKHQWRQGQHGWQVAGIDDIIPPKYVWHVPDPAEPYLVNEMRKYYGKAPAIVELCVQAGAMVPSNYKAMMRIDVVIPAKDEVENAA